MNILRNIYIFLNDFFIGNLILDEILNKFTHLIIRLNLILLLGDPWICDYIDTSKEWKILIHRYLCCINIPRNYHFDWLILTACQPAGGYFMTKG